MLRFAILFALVLLASIVGATTIRVPADQPTIQAGVDAASESDTVLVAPGTYTGAGNYDILMDGKGLVVRSESGPGVTIIDCEGAGRAMRLQGPALSESEINGFSFLNGFGADRGGAIECVGCSPIIRQCVFVNNRADYGGALYIERLGHESEESYTVWPSIINCTFVGNTAKLGAVCHRNYGVSYNMVNTVLYANSSDSGAPLSCWYNAGSSYGSEILVSCNIFGNSPSDWQGRIANFQGHNGNFSLDPVFCDLSDGTYSLHDVSPLLPENNPSGELIGAAGMGCSGCFDVDNDEYCAMDDNCPSIHNTLQEDSDGDGVGDVCDPCSITPNPFGSCCCGQVGDANGDGSDIPTIGDIALMVHLSFVDVPPAFACWEEADMNQSGGCNPSKSDITIGDIAILIDYLFITGRTRGLPDCLTCR